MKKVAAFVWLLAAGSGAETATWLGGEGNFSDLTKWSTGAVPGANADDTIVVPAGSRVNVASGDAAAIAALTNINLQAASSVIAVDSASDININCPILGQGGVVKTGTGYLNYNYVPPTKVPHNAYNYSGATIVSNGHLRLPQNCNYWDFNFSSRLYLYKPARFHIASTQGVSQVATILRGGLFGDGTITNSSAYSQSKYLQFAMTTRSAFAGEMHGTFNLWNQSGAIDLLGTNSTVSGSENLVCNAADLGVMSFGSNTWPSSVGKYSFGFRTPDNNKGAVIRYLGQGETTTKTFGLGEGGYNTLNMGATGGVTFTGQWSGSSGKSTRLLLTGSNTVPAVFSGPFNQSTFPTYIVKSGSGVWTFKDNSGRNNRGVIDVKEGTLRFTSLANRGTVCSLGLSDYLAEDASTNLPTPVDYAFVLGTATTSGTMEYVGTAGGGTDDRVFVLRGDGQILSNGSGGKLSRLALRGGIRALTAGDKTLTLGGDSLVTNTVAGIDDGEGRVNVVKSGAGEWMVSGTNRFSGTLRVTAGTLSTPEENKYLYFRWILKANSYYCGRPNSTFTDAHVSIREFALYDAAGVRQNLNLATNIERSVALLNPGEYTYKKVEMAENTYGPTTNLFDGNTSSGSYISGCTQITATQNWTYVWMRLRGDAGEIVSYDLYGMNESGRELACWSVEGSWDGIHWDLLDEQSYFGFSYTTDGETGAVTTNYTSYANKWLSNGSTAESGATRFAFADNKSVPLTVNLDNVKSVGVSAGALFKSYGQPTTVNGIELDAGNPQGGSFENITFAASGTIHLVNFPYDPMLFTFAFVNCSGVENLKNWNVSVNGGSVGGWRVSYANGTFSVSPSGTTLLLF